MAIYTVTLQNVSGDQVVSLSDGSNLAKLQVNPSRGPQGAGWTGVTYDTNTGRFTFTSNDGLGYVSDDITVGLDAAVAAAQAAQAGAEAAEAATELLFDQFGDQYLGPKASDPTVDNDGNPLVEGAVYFNTTDNVLKFYSGTAWVAPELIATNAATAAQASATAAAASETNAAASESAAATSETNAAASASAAATSETNAATSETNAAASASAASTSETNAAASASAASTSETNAAASASAASTSETNAAASASSASTSASNAATSESNAAASASAASASASNAATSESNAATSAASAAASFDQFDDRYLGAKASDPTLDNDGDPLVTGALYFNTTSDLMKVYNGSSWVDAGSAVNGTAERNVYTATGGQTTFSATYDVGYVDVYLNGVKLVSGTDFTATSGTSIVLASGAAAGDTVDIIAYGAFSLANHYTKTEADSRFVNVTGDTMTGNLDVQGTVTADGLSVDGDGLLYSASNIEMRGDANVRITLGTAGTAGANNSSNWVYGNGSNLRFNNAGGYYSWETLGNEKMRIDSSGNVGIGTSSPSHLTTLSSSGNAITGTSVDVSNLQLKIENPADDTNEAVGLGFGISSNSSSVGSAIIHKRTGGNSQGELHFATKSSTTVGADIPIRMSIDSSGNVGIGTTSPSTTLHLASAGTALRLQDTDTNAYAEISTSDQGALILEADKENSQASSTMLFKVDASERMRIDSSGNLLVGKTSQSDGATAGHELLADGRFYHTKSGDHVGRLNRLSTDGDILRFAKDGTTVGSIGARSGVLYIQGTNATTAGIKMSDGAVRPCNSDGSNSDNDTDLGTSGTRFRNLYLSGGVYVGGTGAANYLDDYEEGAFTPTLVATGTAFSSVTYGAFQSGAYTKIGNQVTVRGIITATATSGGSGALAIGNLPFTSSREVAGTLGYISGLNYDDTVYNQIGLYMSTSGGSRLIFTRSGDNTTAQEVGVSEFTSTFNCVFTATYVV